MAGGLAVKCRRAGWGVQFLTATDGGAGHHEMTPRSLVARRRVEARRAAARIGATTATLGEPDGGLYVTRRTTDIMIAAIRRYRPDVVVAHRTCDYHRDHRMAAQLVLDASYPLKVPLAVPRMRPLDRVPVILYASDFFTEGPAFRAHWVHDIGREHALVVRMMLDHVSQFREWIPWVEGERGVGRRHPADEKTIAAWLTGRARSVARRWGTRSMRAAEAFQVSEYGARATARDLARLLPQ